MYTMSIFFLRNLLLFYEPFNLFGVHLCANHHDPHFKFNRTVCGDSINWEQLVCFFFPLQFALQLDFFPLSSPVSFYLYAFRACLVKTGDIQCFLVHSCSPNKIISFWLQEKFPRGILGGEHVGGVGRFTLAIVQIKQTQGEIKQFGWSMMHHLN